MWFPFGVSHPDGEAKSWMEPTVELATHVGLAPRHVNEAHVIIEHHLEEIRHAWFRHFGG